MLPTDIEEFRDYLKDRNLNLTKEEFNVWISSFIRKEIKKGAFFLRQGEVDKYIAFVIKGCLRLYTIDNKGKEHIAQFAPERWWVSDMDSFIKGVPATYFIDAVEDSLVLLIDSPSHQKVMNTVPQVALFFQQLMQRRQSATQSRVISSMSAPAEERYLEFMKTYPSLARRLPQHMIAAYLGITPESLSRVRKQTAHRST